MVENLNSRYPPVKCIKMLNLISEISCQYILYALDTGQLLYTTISEKGKKSISIFEKIKCMDDICSSVAKKMKMKTTFFLWGKFSVPVFIFIE